VKHPRPADFFVTAIRFHEAVNAKEVRQVSFPGVGHLLDSKLRQKVGQALELLVHRLFPFP
jgi:hypothetical protein